MKKIIIVGAGAMGSAFAVPCLENKNDVTLVGTHLEDELIKGITSNNNFHPALNTELPLKLKVEKFEKLSYGLNAVLDTAAELQARNRADIKLLFIGDGKLKPQLKDRAKAEKLTSCIFMDPLPKLDLAQLLSKCDVGLMILKNIPSFYYGTSPNKFFDYIAAGLPVINNYPGWLADLITQNSCGHVVPPEDPNSFANALIAMADNRQSIEDMRKNSRQLAREKFDRTQLAETFCEFLESNCQ